MCVGKYRSIDDATVVSIRGSVKGKAITVQTGAGPEGSRRLRLPDSMTVGT